MNSTKKKNNSFASLVKRIFARVNNDKQNIDVSRRRKHKHALRVAKKVSKIKHFGQFTPMAPFSW